MKKNYYTFLTALVALFSTTISAQVPSLTLAGVMDLTIPSSMATVTNGSQGKAIEVVAIKDIADLSVYGLGVANNGGGTDGQEYSFPAISVTAGQHILIARDTGAIHSYFGSCFNNFDHVLNANSDITQNGDDAIELFKNGNNIETFGDVNVDGTGQPWEYLDSWAWKDTTIAGDVSASNLFTSGPNTTWTHVLTAAQISDGASSQAAQTITINVTSLPSAGANVRVAKSTANGNNFNGPAQALTLGLNTINVTAVSFNRYVKFQFSSGAVGFDHLYLNGNQIHYGNWGYGAINCSDGSTSTQSSGCRYPLCPPPPPVSPLVGTWKLSPNAGAIGVGPNQGDIGWWSNSAGDVTGRACLFDDSISFDANGNFTHYMDGSTWVENWQDGGGDRCATPVSPHAGGSFTYTYTGTQLTVTGAGAHIGLAKATNQGELSAGNPPALPSSRTYEISFGTNGEMIADINFGGGWWRSVYVQAGNPPPPTYNVTLTVNTANITVGPNGMYAGGGFLGGSNGLQMTDADGDGTWEAVATVTAGSGPNYYAFFNSPSHGGDWGTKEDLNGTTCGQPANYNDRVLPTITSDTTIQHCFGNCASDGTCNPPPATTYNVTLTVNTANITVGPNGMYAGGGFLGGSDGLQMTDADGDGTWEAVATVTAGTGPNYYAFFNSPSHGSDWGTKEVLTGQPCGIAANYDDRVLPTITSDTTIQHCFGSCETDGTCPVPPSTSNVTFSVDMNTYAGSQVAPYTVNINGTFNGWNGTSDPMSDADGDGVWDVTLSLNSGTSIEYKFTVNGWSDQENFAGGEPCTVTAGGFTNRFLAVPSSDSTLGTVCFNSCSACPTVDPCLQTAPYLEDFALGLPTCWNENQTTGSGWVFTGNPGYAAGANGRPSGTYAWIDFSGSDVGAVLNAPPVDISALTTPELSFDYFSDQGTYTVTPANILYIEADNGSSWVTIDSIQDATTPGWNAYTYDITGYDVSGIVTLRFRAESGGAATDYYNDILLDDFNVRETPSCTDPTGLTVGTVTSDSVSLSWTPGGSETQWLVYLVDASGSLSTTTPTTVNSSSVTLAVNPSTAYSAYVQAFCGAGDSSAIVGPQSFTSQCVALTAPYMENFDGLPLVSPYRELPLCWQPQAGPDYWDVTNDAVNNGHSYLPNIGDHTTGSGNYMWIDASGNITGNAMVSPEIDFSGLSNPYVGFYFASNNTTNAINHTINLSAWDAANSSWVLITSASGNFSGWVEVAGNIPSNVSSPTRFKIHADADPNGAATTYYFNDLGVDDFFVMEAPNCPQPTGLTASNITADSVDLSWTAGGTETQWLVYLVDGGTLATTTPISVSSTNAQLAVNSSTTYAAYVQAVCGPGDSSLVTGPLTFTTQVAPGTCGIFTVELTDSYGDGWNGNGLEVVINGTPTDTLTVATGTFASFQIAVNIGDVIDLNYLNTGTWGGENGWNVIDNNGNTIVSVAPTNSSGSAGAGPANTVGITACPACSAPTGVMASNITTNSADVSWTASGSETEWWFVLDGVGQSVTSTTNALTGLSPATVYTVEIAAICGAGDTSSLTLPYTFATACSVASAPYLENFDAGFSPCWTQDTADVFDWTLDANGTPSGGTGPSDDVTGGGNYMFTEASVPRAYGDSAILISEDIDISSLSNPELSFFSHMFGSAIGTLRVDMHDGAGYSTIFTKSGDQGDVWVEENVLLSTTASVVNFKIVAVLDSNSGGQSWPGDMAIDNFGVVEAAANDLAIVDASVPSGCDFDSTQYVSITVVNQGLVTENTFDASYSLNGAAAVTETNSIPMNPGDTLVFPFFTGVDMSLDGVYSFDFSITSAVDTDPSNNNLSASGENFYTPGAPSATGDTICDGDTATVMAMSADGPITWYDAMTGGNVVGSGDNLSVAPTATTSYYAEAKVAAGFSDDFESYNVGDYIAQSDTVNWATWPGGTLGGLYDAPVSNAQAASGSNSLHLDNSASNVPDPVLPFGGQTWTSGSFEFSTNLYVETTAYFNLQGSANIGTVWAMEMTFTGAGGLTDPFTYDLGGGAITGTYPGTGVWFNVTLKCADLTTGTWELFIDGVSKGTATLPNGTAVGGCNLYAAAGNNYYVDDIGWSAVAADACTGARTEAVVTVNDCSNITELTKGNMEVYPNPNNGEFVITTSNEVMNVTITDVRGKVVYTNNTVNNHTINVNLSDLEKGMYMINVETANGTMTENVIVQ